MKRFLSIFLVFVMLACSVVYSGAVQTGNGVCGENLKWNYVGGAAGTLTIEGSGKMNDFSENGAPWAEYAPNIYHLSLPKDLESIGNYAFCGFANFKDEISLSNNITEIGEGAFENSSVQSISIPYTVKKIEKNTFRNCADLTAVELKEIHPGDAISGYVYESAEEIGESAFEYCVSLKKIALPSCLKKIGESAFYSCSALGEVTFGEENNVAEIGDYAFSYCDSLTAFSVPEKLSKINEGVFEGSGLKNIVIPKTVLSIGERAFADCEKLSYIHVENVSCKFFDSDDTTSGNTKIYCHANSAAKNYAIKYSKPYTVYCLSHSTSHQKYKQKSLVKATTKDGSVVTYCPSCGDEKRAVISRIKSITLSKTAYTYSGKTQKPTVKVLDGAGKTISSAYYKVTYSSATSKYVNKYTVKIVFSGNYSGTFVRYYNINPKGTKITKVTSGAGKLGVYWSKQKTQTSGYQIQLCKSKTFKSGVRMITYRNINAGAYTVKSLSRKTGYYIRIRTFKTIGKANYYSGWSSLYGRKTK